MLVPVDNAEIFAAQLLAEYQQPPMDPAVLEEIDAFVDRRVAEGQEGSLGRHR